LQVGAAGQCRYDKIGLITQYLWWKWNICMAYFHGEIGFPIYKNC
jgi:hypothetical protein